MLNRKEKDKNFILRKIPPKKDGFVEAFGILKGKFKGSSLAYISKSRKE